MALVRDAGLKTGLLQKKVPVLFEDGYKVAHKLVIVRRYLVWLTAALLRVVPDQDRGLDLEVVAVPDLLHLSLLLQKSGSRKA